MKDFKKLMVWQKAMDLIDMVFDLYEDQPWQRVAEIKSQSIRAAVSIASNIAEGSSRRSEKDQFRFMETALGSSFELETQTLSLHRRGWVPVAKTTALLAAMEEQQKMLTGFMSKLKA